MANVKNNLGAQRTRASIEHAFLDLASHMPIQKITVAQIVQRCQISRGTFYLHFCDVYDLAEKIGESLLDGLEAELAACLDEVNSHKGDFPFLHVLVAYIENNGERAAFAFSNNVAPATRERMGLLMERFCADALSSDFDGVSGESRVVLSAYVGSGIFGLIERWVADGCKADAKEVARLAGTLIVHGSKGVRAMTPESVG